MNESRSTAGMHPLDQTDYFANLLTDLDRATIRSITALGDVGLDGGVRAAALKHLCSVLARTAARLDEETDRNPIFYDDRARWTGFPGRLQRLWQRIDALGGRLSNKAVRTVQRIPTVGRSLYQQNWWWLGLLVTFGAASSVITGNYLLAGLLIVGRWLGSLAAGGPAVSMGVPGLVAIEQQSDIRRHLLTSCVASHAADLVIIVAAGWRLHDLGEPGWALGTMAAGALASFATLFRIAAERNGVQVRRSVVERFARNGGIGFALAAAYATKLGLVSWAVPPLAFIGAAFGLFGMVEMFRIVMALHYDPRPEIAVTITVDEDNTPRLSGVRRPVPAQFLQIA